MSELTTENIDAIAEELDEKISEIEEKGDLDEGALKEYYFEETFDALIRMKQEIQLRDEFPIEEGTISKTEHGIMIKWFPDAPQSEKDRIEDLLRDMNWTYNKTTRNSDGQPMDQEYFFCQPPGDTLEE